MARSLGGLGYGNNVDMVYDMCKAQRNICSLVYHTTDLKHIPIQPVVEPCSEGYHPKPLQTPDSFMKYHASPCTIPFHLNPLPYPENKSFAVPRTHTNPPALKSASTNHLPSLHSLLLSIFHANPRSKLNYIHPPNCQSCNRGALWPRCRQRRPVR